MDHFARDCGRPNHLRTTRQSQGLLAEYLVMKDFQHRWKALHASLQPVLSKPVKRLVFTDQGRLKSSPRLPILTRIPIQLNLNT